MLREIISYYQLAALPASIKIMANLPFEYPEALLLPLLFWLIFWLKRKRRGVVGFSNLATLKRKIPKASWLKLSAVPLLGILAFHLFVAALANPIYKVGITKEITETRFILLVQDFSGSMNQTLTGRPRQEFVGGNLLTRKKKFELALDGVHRFIDLRPDDYVGLMAFAGFAKLISPFVKDHEILKRRLSELLEIKTHRQAFEELLGPGATNAAEAFWLSIMVFLNYLPKGERPSVGELMDMRASLYGEGDLDDIYIPSALKNKVFEKGRVLIFLTDGEFDSDTTAWGQHATPNTLKLIKLMRRLGIKSYFLLVMPDYKKMNVSLENAITLAHNREEMKTAGKLFFIQEEGVDCVNSVYDQINELEKTKFVIERYDDHRTSRRILTQLAVGFFLCYIFLMYTKRFRRPEL